MQKNEQKELKIPGAQLHMVNNNCTNFQINPCNSFWEMVQTKPQNKNEKTPVKFKIIIQSRWKYQVHNFIWWIIFVQIFRQILPIVSE